MHPIVDVDNVCDAAVCFFLMCSYEKELLEKRDAALRCRVCKATANLVCSRCKVVRYCGADCQKQDWKAAHKNTCKPVLG